MNLGKIILSSCIFLASLPVHSDVDNKLDSWWDSVNEGFNVSAPNMYKIQGSTGYTASAGGVNWRYQQSERVGLGLNVQTPRYSAGCGGIDMYMGGISSVNKAQFRDSLTSIAKNSASMAFLLALKVVSPMLTDVVGKVKEQASKYLNYSMDSCNVAKGVVGSSGAIVSEEISACITKYMGGKKGTPIIDSDYNDAAYRCTTERATKTGPIFGETVEVTPEEINLRSFTRGNIFWQSVTSHIEITTFKDKDFAQLIMNLVGTKIYSPGAATKEVEFNITNAGFTSQGQNIFNVLLHGLDSPQLSTVTESSCPPPCNSTTRNALVTEIHYCDDEELCMATTVKPIGNVKGMFDRVKEALSDIVTKIHNDEPLTPNQRGILASARIPLYKYITVAAAASPFKKATEASLGGLRGMEADIIDKYAEFMARDIVMKGIMDAVSLTKYSVAHLPNGVSDSRTDEYKAALDQMMVGLIIEDRKTAKESHTYFKFYEDMRQWERLVLSQLAHTVTASMMWEN